MTLHRRLFLGLATGAAAIPGALRTASAQAQPRSYPARPVRLVVGFAPGGSTDISARLMGQWLSERLGQPFIIENRPGAGGNTATEAVAHAAPDGYTLLQVVPANTINPALYEKLNFDFVRDIAPIASISREPNVFEVHPSLPVKNIPEFIAYAKSNPGKINIASAGAGSSGHLAGELFKIMTGTEMVHVPYRGGAPALTDLLGGRVQAMITAMASSIEHIRAGRLRALGVTTPDRSEALPDVPAVGEFVPGYEASAWTGIGAPRDTPAGIVNALNAAINAILAEPKVRARISELGASVFAGPPTGFGKFIVAGTEKWAKVIRAANIKAS
jgi:tripartite-type tricarboxylate transporter receptor subunit TctC